MKKKKLIILMIMSVFIFGHFKNVYANIDKWQEALYIHNLNHAIKLSHDYDAAAFCVLQLADMYSEDGQIELTKQYVKMALDYSWSERNSNLFVAFAEKYKKLGKYEIA